MAADDPAFGDVVRVLLELRGHLSPDLARARIARQARDHGYEVHACLQGGQVLAAAGLRPLCTLARGPHLHLDDLVVTAAARGRGVGAALLAHVEAEARARELEAVFLDARPEAAGFYLARGYQGHPAPVHKKRL